MKRKLIIIIDELDRCTPTFAIELLENIKHLFDIEEIVFFIAIDKRQLCESIKSVYGINFDAKTYLQRFFDFELHLPNSESISSYKTKILSSINVRNGNLISEFLDLSFEYLNLTLRDFERITSQIKLFKALHDNPHYGYNAIPTYLLILLVFKYKRPEIYGVFSDNKKERLKEIINIIGDVKISTFLQEYPGCCTNSNDKNTLYPLTEEFKMQIEIIDNSKLI